MSEVARDHTAHADEQPSRPQIDVRPWRLTLVLCLIPALLFAFRWEAGLPSPDAVSLLLAERFAFLGPSATAFLERLFTDFLKVALVALVGVAIVYAVLQAIGISADHQTHAAGGNILRPLTGRMFRVDTPDAYRHAMFDWGSWALLSPLRTGLALFPMVGFIGTVAGLSSAIRDLPPAIEDNSRLGVVLDSLYIAFDTTLLGLFGAVICLLTLRLLEDRIERLERRAGNAA